MSVKEKRVDREFHVYEAYSYNKGFHVSFREGEASHEVKLICPECGQRYDVNWKVRL